MKKNMVLILLAAIASIVFSACSVNFHGNINMNRVEDTSEKTVDAAGLNGIDVSVPVGSIRVGSWDKNEVYVKAVRVNSGLGDRDEMLGDLNDIEIVYETQGDKFSVKVFLPKFKNNGLSVELDISVPKSMSVFNIRSEVGDVRLSGLSGRIDAVNNVGKLDAGGCSGVINMKATTGDITVTDTLMKGQSSITSNAGRVLFDGEIDTDGTYKLTTNTGVVDMTLPADTAFDLDASTSVGKVDCEFDVSGEVKTTGIKGKVNGGGPQVTIVNNIGSVTICKD